MVMPNDNFLFCLCLLICALLSHAFEMATPRNEHKHRWRPGRGLADSHDGINGINIRFHSLDQSLCMVARCGGGADDDGDDIVEKSANNTNRKSPTTAIVKWYMNQLNIHELRTKFISSGILALVADVCAQRVGHSMNLKSTGGNALLILDKINFK